MSGAIRLSPEGLAIRMVHRGRTYLRWDELRAIHREAGDLVERLVFVTDRGRLSMAVGFSARRVAKLQASILDYHERLLRARRRVDLGVDELRRERLERTIRIAKTPAPPRVFAFALTLVAVAAVTTQLFLLAALACVLAVIAVRPRRDRWRVLELGPAGISHGPTDSELRLVPWDEVVAAHRIFTSSETTRAVRLLLGDGRFVDLKGDYDRSLDELCELLDPPLEKVAAARDQMLLGTSLTEAAENAGLPRV